MGGGGGFTPPSLTYSISFFLFSFRKLCLIAIAVLKKVCGRRRRLEFVYITFFYCKVILSPEKNPNGKEDAQGHVVAEMHCVLEVFTLF